ncbi:MAG: polysaccharide deacetylase family protein [Candidatus Sumerlaeaceae bacterium]|nr:polysaccharide deacetylase family protein [Candidatus Sumerlaeaceae bacterium]
MADSKTTLTFDRGCIIRGPRDKKVIALEFTGGEFGDGGTTILDTLKKRGIKGSFYFTGDFYNTEAFKPIIERIRDEGHYLGPHSYAHLLYGSWENPPKLLVTREQFDDDLTSNLQQIEGFGVPRGKARYFIPPYEHFTPEIVEWTKAWGMVLVNYSPGTRTHADYMEDDDPKYVTSDEMIKGLLDYEKTSPDGLNGFMLLTHIGASPRRTRDHLYEHLGEIVDELTKRGYTFVRIDELLGPWTEP